jgi:hypothetical protein
VGAQVLDEPAVHPDGFTGNSQAQSGVLAPGYRLAKIVSRLWSFHSFDISHQCFYNNVIITFFLVGAEIWGTFKPSNFQRRLIL